MKSLLLLTASLCLLSCKGGNDESSSTDKDTGATPASTSGDAPTVIIETSMGTIEAKLHPESAPITVENFLSYVEKGHYDGTIFHRVIPDFMIQGGGFTLNEDVPTEKPTGDGIKNESPKTKPNTRGTLAMARTPDPDSATAQFFINLKGNDFLNYPKSQGHGYAVFGEVTKGMEVVDQIGAVPTSPSYLNSLDPDGRYRAGESENVPVEPVIINSIRVAPAD